MGSYRIPLQIVFYKEDDNWIAHCLEFDLIGHGKTKEDALSLLSKAIEIQIEQTVVNETPKNLFSPADGEFFRMFAAGNDIAVGELKLTIDSIEVDCAEQREYVEQVNEDELALA